MTPFNFDSRVDIFRKMKAQEPMVWENHSKFRADLFRYLGYLCCTPIAALILNLFINDFRANSNLSYFIGIIMIAPGVFFILQASIIMSKLDQELYYVRTYRIRRDS